MNETGRAKIDKEDLEKVKAIGRWSIDDKGYVRNKYNKVAMHRLIMNAKDDEDVDHKKPGFTSKSNNRKGNLRLCTKSENQYNQNKPKNNTSGYKGVSWHNIAKKWHARIKVNKKAIYLGLFDTPEEAYEAYCSAAKKYHGKFARF